MPAAVSRISAALKKRDPGGREFLLGMLDVFPWVRHLSAGEVRAFTVELVEALSDAAGLDVDASIQEVIAGWRATARIKAEPLQLEGALTSTSGDFGPLEIHP